MKNKTPEEKTSHFVKKYDLGYITQKQRDEIYDVFKHFDEHGEKYMLRQTAMKVMKRMCDSGVDDLFVRRIIKSRRLGSSLTLRKMLVLYSTNGYVKWEEYKNKQAHTNSFEYKNEKYGMTRSEFKEYNKSRSVTLENLVNRHGCTKGRKMWDDYCQKQSYAGISLEYFQEKYGAELGKKEYDRVCKEKSHTVSGYMLRLGISEDEAIRMIEDYWSKISSNMGGVSSMSQDFCWDLYSNMKILDNDKVYFSSLNKEFGKYDKKLSMYRLYDFTIIGSCDIMIEFNGDFYHANPELYKPDDVIIGGKTAKDMWLNEESKKDLAILNGFHYITVWEKDYLEDKDNTIKRCIDEIERIRELQNN